MRTVWNLKAYETELPPLGSSEDNLGGKLHQQRHRRCISPQRHYCYCYCYSYWSGHRGVSVIYQTVHGCSEAHWRGSSESEPVLNQTRPLIDALNQRYFISIPNMMNAKRGGTIRTTQCQIHRACLMATFGPRT